MNLLQWWRSGPSHRRWRRRLIAFSAPVAVVLVVVAAKGASIGIAQHLAAADFAAGAQAVSENRLEDADREFAEALARTDPSLSCPVRVNLELVRETLGDRAAGTFDAQTAIDRYRAAAAVVAEAPDGCFADNADPDERRRAVLEDAASRLNGKIAAAQSIPPAPEQLPTAAVPPPPAASSPGSPVPERDAQRRLNPGGADPSDRLRQILRDAAENAAP